VRRSTEFPNHTLWQAGLARCAAAWARGKAARQASAADEVEIHADRSILKSDLHQGSCKVRSLRRMHMSHPSALPAGILGQRRQTDRCQKTETRTQRCCLKQRASVASPLGLGADGACILLHNAVLQHITVHASHADRSRAAHGRRPRTQRTPKR